MTPAEAYRLADYAYRVICPAFLAYDDGVRKSFPEEAQMMREASPITNAQTAQFALKELTQKIIPRLVSFRDGQITVPLKQAHWLLMAAQEIEKGNAIPLDYAGDAFEDLGVAMGISWAK